MFWKSFEFNSKKDSDIFSKDIMKKINFVSKFNKFNELWSPKVIAEMNDYQFKLANIKNDFICIVMKKQMKPSF